MGKLKPKLSPLDLDYNTRWFPWKCPRCGIGAWAGGHGKDRRGFVCQCNGMDMERMRNHGVCKADPCPHAECSCGWEGPYPTDEHEHMREKPHWSVTSNCTNS